LDGRRRPSLVGGGRRGRHGNDVTAGLEFLTGQELFELGVNRRSSRAGAQRQRSSRRVDQARGCGEIIVVVVDDNLTQALPGRAVGGGGSGDNQGGGFDEAIG